MLVDFLYKGEYLPLLKSEKGREILEEVLTYINKTDDVEVISIAEYFDKMLENAFKKAGFKNVETISGYCEYEISEPISIENYSGWGFRNATENGKGRIVVEMQVIKGEV